MNAVIDAIRVRRSVRAYEDRPVPREMIEAIIDAGNWAPCGCNQQRWRFVVVQRGESRQTLVDVTTPTFRRVLGATVQSQEEYMRALFLDYARGASACHRCPTRSCSGGRPSRASYSMRQ
jgi:nitroreductase